MGNLGAPELILILLVIIVFFGAKKIPEIAQGVGKGIREFRKASREAEAEAETGDPTPMIGDKSPCPYCSTPVAVGAKFCPSCGKSLQGVRCSKCGATNDVGSRFCKECGTQLAH